MIYPFFSITALPQTHTITSAMMDGVDLLPSVQSTGTYTDQDGNFIRGWTVEAPGLTNSSYPLAVQIATGNGDAYEIVGELKHDDMHMPMVLPGMFANTIVYSNDTIGMIVAIKDPGVLDTITVSYPTMMPGAYVYNPNATVTITPLDPVSAVDVNGDPVTLNTAQVIIRDWTAKSENYINGLMINTTPAAAQYETYVQYMDVGLPSFLAGNTANTGIVNTTYSAYITSGGGGDTTAPNHAPVMSVTTQMVNVTVGSTSLVVPSNPATDSDADPLTYTIGGVDASSFVLGMDGSVTLAPGLPIGTYTFTLQANDGNADSNVATYEVHVVAPAPVPAPSPAPSPSPVTVLPRTGGSSSGRYGRAGTGVLSLINTPTKQYGHDFKNTGTVPLVVDKAVLLARANQYTKITGVSLTVVDTPAVSPVILVQNGGTLNLHHGDTEDRPSIRQDDGMPQVLNDFTITIPVGSTARIRWLEIVE